MQKGQTHGLNVGLNIKQRVIIKKTPWPDKILRFRICLFMLITNGLLDMPYAHIGPSGGAFYKDVEMIYSPAPKSEKSWFAIDINLKESKLRALLPLNPKPYTLNPKPPTRSLKELRPQSFCCWVGP